MKDYASVVVVTKKLEIKFDDGLGPYVEVEPADLIKAADTLRSKGYDWFLFVTGVDYPDHIELVYRVQSLSSQQKNSIFLKTKVHKSDPSVDSVVSIWPAANWHEREVYDLFGVNFKGHPNLKRIFLPDDWEGYPLRKDFSSPALRRRPDYY